ncbi:MAG: DUF4238 domain-containing protein, partial [Cytophagaceae bacterium]|nr:DUF4238 domain-containing protein [Cytophagaceae bacterium]
MAKQTNLLSHPSIIKILTVMPEKKNNHIIPRCILNEWKIYNGERLGVYVFEVGKNDIDFFTSEGKRAYSFDIEKYIYVPKINEERRYGLENLFSSIESTLAQVIRKIKADTHKP